MPDGNDSRSNNEDNVVPIAERYRTIADLPASLAVFPLRGCILLPRAVLPLHVFEPRYLAMLDAAISTTRLIGIIQPDPDAGERESPSGSASRLRSVGCAGRITSFQELDDGRLVIALTGVCRFETRTETTTATPYRTFDVDFARFSGDLAQPDSNGIDRPALLSALADYLAAQKLEADWKTIEQAEPESLVNALAIMSPFAPEEKQALLEAAGIKERAEALIALARMELAGSGRKAPVRLQ